MASRTMPAILVALISCVVVGCQTPLSVRELARKTSDNAVALSIDLDAFVRTSGEAAALRVDTISRLAYSTGMDRAEFEQDLALAAKAGHQSRTAQLAALKKVAEDSRAARKKVAEDNATLKEKIKSALAPLKVQSAELLNVGDQLLEISKEDNSAARVAFLVGFAKEVNGDLEKAKANAQPAVDAAKKQAGEANQNTSAPR